MTIGRLSLVQKTFQSPLPVHTVMQRLREQTSAPSMFFVQNQIGSSIAILRRVDESTFTLNSLATSSLYQQSLATCRGAVTATESGSAMQVRARASVAAIFSVAIGCILAAFGLVFVVSGLSAGKGAGATAAPFVAGTAGALIACLALRGARAQQAELLDGLRAVAAETPNS